jgi:HK97 family phage major capsid protein
MKKLTDIRARRAAIETEQRTLLDAADKAGKDDLDGAELEKFNALQAEDTTLKGTEDRARVRDELDRKAEGKPAGPGDQAAPGTVRALKPEQRMAELYPAGDRENLSLARAVRGAVLGDWSGADAERRAMGTTTSTLGGFLVPSPISANIIDMARNRVCVVLAGALTIPMETADLTVVQVTTDPTAAWRAEGETISESDGGFAALNLSTKSLAALVRCNAELLEDVPAFQAQLEIQLAAALALKLDYAALYGIGAASEPRGLRNDPNVNEVSMGTNGAAATTFDEYLDAAQKVEDANGMPTACIYAPRTKNKLAKLVTGISGDKTKLVPPADFTALRRFVTNQVGVAETQGSSSVASTSFVGDFTHMALAIRSNIVIEASRTADTAFAKNQIMIRAIMRADVAVIRPTHFCRIVGIL